MAFVEIHIHKHGGGKHRHKKHLYLFINNVISKKMDLILKIDKGSVTGRLIVKDQFGTEIPVSGASYSSTDGGIFNVSGDDGSFTIAPAGVGSATFNYSANGLSGSGTITVEQAASVASSIDFEITTPQQP